MGCAVAFFVAAIMFASFMYVSGFYSFLAGCCVIIGAVIAMIALMERAEQRRIERERGHYGDDPAQGYVAIDPETGEELRILNGRRYHKVRGKWVELKKRR